MRFESSEFEEVYSLMTMIVCAVGEVSKPKKKKREEPVVGPQWTKELGLADSSCLPNLFVDS